VKAEDSRFLAPVLGSRTDEDASHFAHQGPFHPKLPRSIKELPHLAAHIAKACGGPKDDGISGTEFIYGANRNVRKGFLSFQCTHFLEYFPR